MWIGRTGAPSDDRGDDDGALSNDETPAGEGEGGALSHSEPECAPPALGGERPSPVWSGVASCSWIAGTLAAATGVPASRAGALGSGRGPRGAGEPAGVDDPPAVAAADAVVTVRAEPLGTGGGGRVATGEGELALARLLDEGAAAAATAAMLEIEVRERRVREATAPALTTC